MAFKCEDCRFSGEAGSDTFVCRRFPPRVMLDPRPSDVNKSLKTVWPIVHRTDWCGEFKEGEIKNNGTIG